MTAVELRFSFSAWRKFVATRQALTRAAKGPLTGRSFSVCPEPNLRFSLLLVAITERTRKIFWVTAGGRCSICRVQVAGERTEADDPSVFGEEAHIVARSAGGPRSGSYTGDINGYDNLILLCSKCHKQVDDQVNAYPVDLLLQIKRDHEAWVAKLGEKTEPGPVRLVPDPEHPTPKVLKLFTTGTAFWDYFSGSKSFSPGRPEGLSDEDEDLIAGFFQELQDWMDLAGMGHDTFKTNRDASKSLGSRISELAEAGFLLGARRRYMLLTGGIDEAPVPWRSTDVEIHRASEAILADTDGQPLKFGEQNG